MLDRLLTIVFLVFFVASSTVMVIIAAIIRVVTQPFDRRLVIQHRFACFWGSLYIWTMPAWTVHIEGRHHIDKNTTYVVVSNHQSLVDILAGYRLFFHFKWVAKAELFNVPYIGWNLRLNRYIKLKREDRRSIIEMMREAQRNLMEGSSVFLFPEGTRSETGQVKPFKSGAFALAKRAKVPILPIAIDGSKDALPKHSLHIEGRHRIHVTVLEPIPYDSFAEMPTRKLAEMVREQIAEIVEPVKAS